MRLEHTCHEENKTKIQPGCTTPNKELKLSITLKLSATVNILSIEQKIIDILKPVANAELKRNSNSPIRRKSKATGEFIVTQAKEHWRLIFTLTNPATNNEILDQLAKSKLFSDAHLSKHDYFVSGAFINHSNSAENPSIQP